MSFFNVDPETLTADFVPAEIRPEIQCLLLKDGEFFVPMERNRGATTSLMTAARILTELGHNVLILVNAKAEEMYRSRFDSNLRVNITSQRNNLGEIFQRSNALGSLTPFKPDVILYDSECGDDDYVKHELHGVMDLMDVFGCPAPTLVIATYAAKPGEGSRESCGVHNYRPILIRAEESLDARLSAAADRMMELEKMAHAATAEQQVIQGKLDALMSDIEANKARAVDVKAKAEAVDCVTADAASDPSARSAVDLPWYEIGPFHMAKKGRWTFRILKVAGGRNASYKLRIYKGDNQYSNLAFTELSHAIRISEEHAANH